MGFRKQKLIGTEGAVLLGMVYNFLPFMILPIYTVLKKIDTPRDRGRGGSGRESALGCLPAWSLPLSVPGVVSRHHDGVHAGGDDVRHFRA